MKDAHAGGYTARNAEDDASHALSRLNLVGASHAFREALDTIRNFAASDATVLIQGETGTGKELAARAIHYLGPRREMPFVPVNCGAVPDNLLESEFFGHVRGAFTDAREARRGLITQACGGTLFLDEIEAMTPRAQVTLLRFLQDKDYRPVGATGLVAADVRIIASTNAPLKAMAKRGEFRSDLLFRLDVLPIHLPALRQREADVALLAAHFLERLNRRQEGAPTVLHPSSIAVLQAHSWPGNVRELENLLQREFVLAQATRVIRIASVADDPHGEDIEPAPSRNEAFRVAKARAVAQFERQYFVDLMSRTAGNISLASRLSGKDRGDIARLLRKHGIERREFAGESG